MMLENDRLLPTASFEELNPAIKGGEKLCVLKKSVPWPDGAPKRVSVSNYGKAHPLPGNLFPLIVLL